MDDPTVTDQAEQEPAPKPAREYVEDLCKQARSAAGKLASLSTAVKNQALTAMAESLIQRTDEILAENAKDLENFGTSKDKAAMADR
jgi:glutamate-5-semialdehyde dehydrogenase